MWSSEFSDELFNIIITTFFWLKRPGHWNICYYFQINMQITKIKWIVILPENRLKQFFLSSIPLFVLCQDYSIMIFGDLNCFSSLVVSTFFSWYLKTETVFPPVYWVICVVSRLLSRYLNIGTVLPRYLCSTSWLIHSFSPEPSPRTLDGEYADRPCRLPAS